MDSPVVVALVSGGVSIICAMLTSLVAFQVAVRRAGVDEKLARLKAEIDRELAEQKAKLDDKATYAAEQIALDLLRNGEAPRRYFSTIKSRIGGFDDDKLRQILLRAGAVRSNGRNGEELWGLVNRDQSAP